MNKKFNLAIPKIRIYQILFPSDSCETFQMALKFVLFSFFFLVRSYCHHRRVLTLHFSSHTYTACQIHFIQSHREIRNRLCRSVGMGSIVKGIVFAKENVLQNEWKATTMRKQLLNLFD